MDDFRLCAAVVRPRLNEIELQGRVERLSAKFVDVLVVLAEQQGQVVAKAELLRRVWNDPLVSDELLAHAIWMLRKTLHDDAKRPTYIETIPRRGYRLIAAVEPLRPAAASATSAPAPVAVAVDGDRGEEEPGSLLSQPAELAPPVRPPAPRWPWLLAPLGLLALVLLGYGWARPEAARLLPFRAGGAATALQLGPNGATWVVEGGTLYALDRTHGGERWRVGGSRSVFPNLTAPTLFLGSEDGYVYALDAGSGHELWRHAAGRPVATTPAQSAGQVVFADAEGWVTALGAERGELRWQRKLQTRAIGPVLALDDTFVVRTIDAKLTALAAANGELRWQQAYAAPLNDPIVVDPKRLLISGDAGLIAVVDASDGRAHWQFQLPGVTRPLISQDRVYAVSRFGEVVAAQLEDGATLWRNRVDVGSVRPPVLWGNRLVVALDGGALGLLDPEDGRLRRRIRLPDVPAVLAADQQQLVFATLAGALYQLERQGLSGRGNDLTLSEDAELRATEAKVAALDGSHRLERLDPRITLPQLEWRHRVTGQARGLRIAADGSILVGDEGSVAALSNRRSPLWSHSLPTSRPSPAALGEGRFIIGRRDEQRIYAHDVRTGKTLWQFDTGGAVIAPPSIADGRVFVGSDSGRLQALDAASGKLLWTFATARPIRGGAAVSGDTVVFGSADRNVYALNVVDGSERWRFRADDWVVAQPLILADRVFIGAGNGEFHALDFGSGRPLWRFASRGKIWSFPAGDENFVYFASGDGHVYALRQHDGSEVWRRRIGVSTEGGVTLAGDVLYIGSSDFHLYALDRHRGQALWRLRTGGPVLNAAVAGGWLVVGSSDQHLYGLSLPDLGSGSIAYDRAARPITTLTQP